MEEQLVKYDPWKDTQSLIDIILSNNKILILGPNKKINKKNNEKILNSSIKNNLQRIYILFNIRKYNDNLYLSSNTIGNTGFNNLYLEINLTNKKANIKKLEKSDIYSGTDLILLGLKILQQLDINIVTLDDDSKIKCTNRNNLNSSYTKDLQYNIISFFKYKKTYYMKFRFLPYIGKQNMKNILDNILNDLYKISWDVIDNYIKQGCKTLQKINNGKYNIISNKLRFSNINKWRIYWNIIKSSYELLYNEYHTIYNSPFEALQKFNENKCKIFANWLELYSLSSYIFKQINSYNFYTNNNNLITLDIPGKEDIKKLLEIFRNVEWKINDIKSINTNKYNNRNVV